MDDNQAGPSGVKRCRKLKDRYPLTEEQLLRYLEDSDDDIKDPNYEDSTSSADVSDESDSDTELNISSSSQYESNIAQSLDIPDEPQVAITPQTHTNVVNWTSVPDIPTNIPFSRQREVLILPEGNTPVDYFNLLVTEDFLQLVVRETNVYAEEIFLSANTQEKSRITRWKELSVEEFKIFIGLFFHMGTIRLNRLQDYWKKHRLFNLPSFSSFMSRDRFMIILRCLHFNKNPEPGQPKPADRLFKIRPIIDYFNSRMISIYYPGKNLSLDESMVLWRGRLVFRQYIKNKKHKYGVKLYLLTEPDGTVMKFAVYTGTLDDFGGKGHAANIVLHLTEEKLDVGHSIYMDNYYNSYELASQLLSRKTYCTGTLRVDRKNNPIDVKTAKLKKGETIARYSNGVMVAKWRDNRDVMYISTEFRNNLINYFNRRNQEKQKPEAVYNYNSFMGGIDKKDQMMSYYPCERKTMRWYKKIGIHILYMLLMNSYFLYQKYVANLSLYDYRLKILEYLLSESANRNPSEKRQAVPTEHVPKKNPATGEQKKHAHRRCTECNKNKIRKETVYHCPACPKLPALCLEPCFSNYHKNL